MRLKKPKRGRPRTPLDIRHYLAIELLTTSPTENLEDIAKACGVDRRTLFRWRERKDFTRELNKVQQRKINEYIRRGKARIKHATASYDYIEELFRACDLI
ncbi:hypothetical protein J2Z32_002141 [Paenibacillus turicensis]|uniref:Homeodomain phBC6A51-type domain-containing protein n=1 Tax=Paenibacillus turicensis TaxID=160487 RepID=A0ABS4FSE1_9BACL|nr:hypothetical protein [Paenibacillus turicensis]